MTTYNTMSQGYCSIDTTLPDTNKIISIFYLIHKLSAIVQYLCKRIQ